MSHQHLVQEFLRPTVKKKTKKFQITVKFRSINMQVSIVELFCWVYYLVTNAKQYNLYYYQYKYYRNNYFIITNELITATIL